MTSAPPPYAGIFGPTSDPYAGASGPPPGKLLKIFFELVLNGLNDTKKIFIITFLPDPKAAEAAQSAYYDPSKPQYAYVPPPAYYVSS